MLHTVALVALIVLLIVSGIGLIVGVLLHSGKGTGVSEVLSGYTGNMGGTGIIERNLDRITVVFAVTFLVDLLLLMLVYPTGTIG